MRRYSLLAMLLITAGMLFYAVHEYVEISAFNHAQAQATPEPVAEDGETEGHDCYGDCFPNNVQDDRNTDSKRDDAAFVASVLQNRKPKPGKKTRDGDQ